MSLVVTTPAPDLNLLTLAEIRLAVGVPTGSDAELTALGLRISAAITAACNVARGGAVPPTLRLETLTETLRFRGGYGCAPWASNTCGPQEITLSRRPVTEIQSAVDGTATLSASDYDLDGSSAVLKRLQSDCLSSWCGPKVTIVYKAGWAVVPDDLKLAASKLAATVWTETARDPNLKRIKVEGVGEREYFYGSVNDPAIPAEVMELLEPYRNIWIA